MKLDSIDNHQYADWLINKYIWVRDELKSLLELTWDEWNEEIYDMINERIQILHKKRNELYNLLK